MTSDSTDDGVLTPDELRDVLADENVERLDENRYLVRPETDSTANQPESGPTATDAVDEPTTEGSLAVADEPHGVDLTLKTDGELAYFQTTSHDVREVFADMLSWYASQLDDDLSPTETLRVLLATTDLE